MLYVSGGSVYAVGEYSNGTNAVAVVWKGGVKTDLTDGSSYASATSVYVNVH